MLNTACILLFLAVYVEKGMGIIIPGFVPSTLGEIYQYIPSFNELVVTAGIWAFGALFYTFLAKVGINIYTGDLVSKNYLGQITHDEPENDTREEKPEVKAKTKVKAKSKKKA